MQESATNIDKVVVKTKLITHEADRFVMNVQGSNLAIGRNVYELLSVSPGVRADDNGIKINGRGGTRVIVGERMLNLSSDELQSYLKSIPAKNVQKIEVIPMAGADYDADITGGIIKITLKRMRYDGVDGSVNLSASSNDDGKWWTLQPSFRLNYQKGKLNLYTNGSYYKYDQHQYVGETMKYFDTAGNQTAHVLSGDTAHYIGDEYNFGLGAIYDFDARHSLGGEFNFHTQDATENVLGQSTYDILSPASSLLNDSDYRGKNSNGRMSGTLNYTVQLDTLGSSFKLIGDYTQSSPESKTVYINTATPLSAASPSTATYKMSDMDSDYRIFALTANMTKKFNPATSIRFGGKYSYNTVFSDMKYYNSPVASPYEWTLDAVTTQPATEYKEQVGALYFIFDKTLGKFSLSAGLRAEYTDQNNSSTGVHKQYLELFPNATLSYVFDGESGNILTGQYGRSISRPSFSILNDYRAQMSEYSIVIGNPKVGPQYVDGMSLTYVFRSKYVFSLFGVFTHDMIIQQLFTTPGSDMVYYQYTNMAKSFQRGVSATLPFDITGWWSFTANMNVIRLHTETATEKNDCWYAYLSGQTSVTLPHNFILDISGSYSSDITMGNLEQDDNQSLNIMIKKRLLDSRMTLSAGVQDLFRDKQRIFSHGTGFTDNFTSWGMNPSFTFSVNYNFAAGKKFNSRKVESGASADKSRM